MSTKEERQKAVHNLAPLIEGTARLLMYEGKEQSVAYSEATRFWESKYAEWVETGKINLSV